MINNDKAKTMPLSFLMLYTYTQILKKEDLVELLGERPFQTFDPAEAINKNPQVVEPPPSTVDPSEPVLQNTPAATTATPTQATTAKTA